MHLSYTRLLRSHYGDGDGGGDDDNRTTTAAKVAATAMVLVKIKNASAKNRLSTYYHSGIKLYSV